MVLKKLRHKKTAKKIWIVLAILILPAFILWGSGSVMRGRQELTYAGIISGRKIPLTDYRDAIAAVNNQAIMRFGDNPSEIKKHVDLPGQAWIRLILLDEARKRRISSNDKEVVEEIQSYAFFQRKDRFDGRLYSELLQYVFHTPARVFEEQMRQNIIISKLYEGVTSGIKVTDPEIKAEYKKANEELSIYYIASLPSDFTKDINPSDPQIKDYFAKNKLNFKRPLSFNLEYVSLDSQGRDENQAKDKIKKLFLRLSRSKKEGFADIAREFGLQVKESGLFAENDPIPGIGWLPQIISRLSKSKTGDYLPVIHMDNSYYILRIKEVKAPYIPDFESIKEEVKEAFIKEKAQETAKAKIEACLKELIANQKLNQQAADFERVAKEQGLKSGVTEMFKYGSYIEKIGGSDIFWLNAEGLKEGGFSNIISVPEGFYIIKLKSRSGIDENKFTQEKTEFARNLTLQKKAVYFAQFTEELRKKSQTFF
jgi:hypothetical protein